MDIVIIGQNEGSSILKMYESLKNIKGNRVWVLDRCTDDSEDILIKLNEKYIKTPEYLSGRQTSFARNLGLSYTDKNSDVLFLDGDRFITKGDIESLNNTEYDIELLMLDKDPRILTDYKYTYGEVNNGFYSCGIFFKRSAINKIVEFQQGQLFLEAIQDVWGIEDVYLGDVSYHLSLTCNYNTDISLFGEFGKLNVDSMDVIMTRFKLRDKLKVKWN